MQIRHLALVILLLSQSLSFAQKTVVVNPNDIQLSPYRHKELPVELLKRIRATTDVFQAIDGLSYDQAVDLYKRDVNPEENLVIWEEMVRGYKSFCKARCTTAPERMDVYRALLLRSMFEEPEAIRRTQPKVLALAEVQAVVKLYRLPAKPIDVVKGK
ncbi:hypothetical protein [Roseateles microcysteis]|uniref:hypothetical protein n=1 Tax=Roseateles microcysteis TaxID=3119057 RepID=UPI002FE50333